MNVFNTFGDQEFDIWKMVGKCESITYERARVSEKITVDSNCPGVAPIRRLRLLLLLHLVIN